MHLRRRARHRDRDPVLARARRRRTTARQLSHLRSGLRARSRAQPVRLVRLGDRLRLVVAADPRLLLRRRDGQRGGTDRQPERHHPRLALGDGHVPDRHRHRRAKRSVRRRPGAGSHVDFSRRPRGEREGIPRVGLNVEALHAAEPRPRQCRVRVDRRRRRRRVVHHASRTRPGRRSEPAGRIVRTEV